MQQLLRLRPENTDREYLDRIRGNEDYLNAGTEERLEVMILCLWEIIGSKELQKYRRTEAETPIQLSVFRNRRAIINKFKRLDLWINNLSTSGKLEVVKMILADQYSIRSLTHMDKDNRERILDSGAFLKLNPRERLQLCIIMLGSNPPEHSMTSIWWSVTPLGVRHITYWTMELSFHGRLSIIDEIVTELNPL